MEQEQLINLEPPVNPTPFENRAHQVYVELYVMRIPLDEVSKRHGLTPSMARELAVQAFNDAMAKRQYAEVLASAIADLHEARMEIWRLYKLTPDEGERWHEELTREGDVERLKEQVSNVPLKAKLMAEIRQNVLATKTMVGVDVGQPLRNGGVLREILDAVAGAVGDAVRQEQQPKNITPVRGEDDDELCHVQQDL